VKWLVGGLFCGIAVAPTLHRFSGWLVVGRPALVEAELDWSIFLMGATKLVVCAAQIHSDCPRLAAMPLLSNNCLWTGQVPGSVIFL